jgi:hypothetical protein
LLKSRVARSCVNLNLRYIRQTLRVTHGRTAKTNMNSRNKNRSRLLTGSSESGKNLLESRVAQLEARIEQMQAEIDGIAGMPPERFFGTTQATGKKRPGPSEQIGGTQLLLRRDNIVRWLERDWPKIVGPLLAAKSAGQVATCLKAIVPAPSERPEWQQDLIGHCETLLNFLRSEKFRKKPPKRTVVKALCSPDLEQRRRAANRLPTRQIANAMAGVPNLSWRTSLDRCSKTPCTNRVGFETTAHYQAQFGIS